MNTPTLHTKRLTLRALQSEDAKAIQEYFPNWNIVQHLSTKVPWPYPDNGAEQFVQMAVVNEEAIFWAITLSENKAQLVGLIEYRVHDEGDGNRGFWLAEHLHGRGLMTEAIKAMQDYLFFDLMVDKIRVGNSPENPASRRLKEKTGGVYIGTIESPHHSGCNLLEVWEITQTNWRDFRRKTEA